MININPLLNNNSVLSANQNKTINIVKHKKLKDAAQAFESLMVYQMFKSLKKNIGSSGLLNKNHAYKIFDDFLTQERSQIASNNMSLGIAEAIYKQNIKYIK